MAKITIAGKACVVTSSLKFEDIKAVERYRPDALTIYGGEDGKEPLFTVRTGEKDSICDFGICFSGESRNDKLATLTMPVEYDGEDVSGYIVDKIGTAISYLNQIEEALPIVVRDINNSRTVIMNNITVVE